MTVCNQNRVDCERLEAIKQSCDKILRYENISTEASNITRTTTRVTTTMNPPNDESNETNLIWKRTKQPLSKEATNTKDNQKDVIAIDKNSPEYTICLKRSVSEKKSLVVLPSNWRDKIRDELIEDLCSENKFGKELLDSELQQSEQVSTSPTTLKLPTEWRTMTRAEMYGIMLENRNHE